MCRPGCSHLFPIYSYIKLSSHDHRSEVEEGCPMLFGKIYNVYFANYVSVINKLHMCYNLAENVKLYFLHICVNI